jgi:hypothetical protein
METIDKLKEIIRNNNMSTRPEFTSGRGAILCDLNGTQLEKIYQGIKKEFGDKPAKNFVKMVDDIKVMACTTFLEELYMLCGNGWKYRKKPKEHQTNGISIPKNKQGEYDDHSMVSGMLGMLAAMSSGGRDETAQIKNYFLSCHGIKPKGDVVYNYWGNGHHAESNNYID